MNEKYKKILKISERWEKADKKSIAVTAFVVFLLVLSCFLFIIHLHDITNKYKDIINKYVTSKVENTGFLTISDTLFIVNKLEGCAKSIGQLDENELKNDSDRIKGIIRSTAEQVDISSVAYVDVTGEKIHEERFGEINTDYKVFIEKYDGSAQFCLYNNDSEDSAKCGFASVIPVQKDNVTVGFVIGITDYERVIEYDEIREVIRHDEVILDGNSDVVALVRNNQYMDVSNHYNFFDELATHAGQEDFSKMTADYEEHMHSRTSGSFVTTSGEKDILFIYQPFDNTNGWCVVSCIPVEAMSPIVNKMLVNSIIVFVVIVLLLSIASLMIISHIRGEQKRVSNLEYLDGLTGVPNRNSFTSKAQELLKENKDWPYYISCFDIVNFRIINETYGHERSDEIIKALANAAGEAFGKNEVFGRLSADVFVALVVNDGEDEERVAFIEEKVTQAARKVFINHPIKIKKGYFEVVNYMESVSRMIDKANIARKFATNDTKTYTCKYSDELMEDARKTEKIESQMNEALKNGEFVPYLQAKFDMEKNHVCGAEALVRWRKPDGSLVPPGDFIPLFEKNGFVEKIDFYMLESVCKYLRQMIDEGRAVYPVSVNQSRYLLNDPEYVSKVRNILLKYEIPVGLIELELTETVFFHEKDRMVNMMNELKEIHVNLSIDDFGSGYSSFNLLKDVPFDVLKIDRAFLSDTEQSEKGRWILREIVEMAHGLGMSVICEGVETREQIEMLLSIKCKHAQGFYYARPIPLEEYISKYNVLQG